MRRNAEAWTWLTERLHGEEGRSAGTRMINSVPRAMRLRQGSGDKVAGAESGCDR
jgi:hypothetical protein